MCVIIYDDVNIVDIHNCFYGTEWCGCDINDDSVMIGWYRIDTPNEVAWYYDHPFYLKKMKCAKPENMIIDQCQVLDISTSFDYGGSVYCPDDHFIKGINSTGHSQHIFQWEELLCCNFTNMNNETFNVSNVNTNDWETCLDYAGWCNVSEYTFMNGLYRSSDPVDTQNIEQNLHNIEYAYSQSISLITDNPSQTPTHSTINPSLNPTTFPTETPTLLPSNAPTISPSNVPTTSPTNFPAINPTRYTVAPTIVPSIYPSNLPTQSPSDALKISPDTSNKGRSPKISTSTLQIILIVAIIIVLILAISICCVYKRLTNVKKPFSDFRSYMSSTQDNATAIDLPDNPNIQPQTQNGSFTDKIPGETNINSNDSEMLYSKPALNAFQPITETPGNIDNIGHTSTEGNTIIPNNDGVIIPKTPDIQ